MPITGIARRRQGDVRACVEEGEKGQNEGGGRSRAHDDAVVGYADAVAFAIAGGDACPQSVSAERCCVAERLAIEGIMCRGTRDGGRGRAGLADLHVDDAATLGFEIRGPAHHVHDDEARDLAALRCDEAPMIAGRLVVVSRHG